MKFFQPQIQLVRETHFDEPDGYYLHVVTFCPRTSFCPDGFSTDDAALSEGVYRVIVKIQQDPALPDFEFITPVVHTISLGNIAFPNAEGWIDVQVQGAVFQEPAVAARGETKPPATTVKTGGTGTVSTTNAQDIVRPIDDDSLFGFVR